MDNLIFQYLNKILGFQAIANFFFEKFNIYKKQILEFFFKALKTVPSTVNLSILSIKTIKKIFWFIESYQKLWQKLSLSIKKSVIELSTLILLIISAYLKKR
jgi:hypothetical protein